jgi:hypothetical protein
VHVLALEPVLPAVPELLADPILEVLDRVTADTKLDEMKWHDEECIAVRDVAKLQQAARAAA